MKSAGVWTDSKGRSTGSADDLKGDRGEAEVSDLSPRRKGGGRSRHHRSPGVKSQVLQILLLQELGSPGTQGPGTTAHTACSQGGDQCPSVKPQCPHPYQHSQAHCSPGTSHLRTRLSGLRAESTSQDPLEQGAGTGLRVALASRLPSSTPTYTPGTSVLPKMGLAQQVCVKNSRPGAAAASQAPPLILPFQLHSSRGSRGCSSTSQTRKPSSKG